MENTNTVCPIYFTDYDKISDVLLHLDRDFTFRFNVRLANQDKDGNRKIAHREILYDVNKYNDTDTVANIKREMDFYFSIEHSKDYEGGITLREFDVYKLKGIIRHEILPWYSSNESGAFRMDETNGLIVIHNWDPVEYKVSERRYLLFEPIVYEDFYGNKDLGIRMAINYDDNCIDMSYRKFIAFYQLLANTDMYSVASSMMAYAKMPPYGINLVELND